MVFYGQGKGVGNRCIPQDAITGMGEIGEDAPNEADFDETMSIVEPQDPIQVTANPGALSGLDNATAQLNDLARFPKGEPRGEPVSAAARTKPRPPESRNPS